jgi:predicted RNase H-like HicB family nuclease
MIADAMTTVTAYVEKDPETGMYVAVAPGVRGAHTQAESLDALKANLEEVLALCVEEGWLTPETAPG